MLSLNDVEKIYHNGSYPTYAIKNINLEVYFGEILGILGKSNSGKTTLLRCLHCLEDIDMGSITIDQVQISYLTPDAQKVTRQSQGMIFAEPLLLSSQTVYQNIALATHLSKLPKSNQQERIELLLKCVGLFDKANCYPSELTLGQQYRVSIARALVVDPKIVFCDDITKNCDPKTTHGLLKLLKDLQERFLFTLIIATQNMEVVKSICHRTAILHRGEILEQGSVSSIFTKPQSEIAKEFVKAVTRAELPIALRRRLKAQETQDTYPVLRLVMNNTSQEPIIAHAIQHFGLSMNILQAHLESVRDDNIGTMIAELRGPKPDIQLAIEYLEQRGLYCEVLGYVL